MNSIFEDLYFGNISPWERPRSKCPERSALDVKIEKEKEYFTQKMSLDDFKRFETLESLYSQSGDFVELDAFTCGFKLATILMCAVFTGEPAYNVK